MLAFHNDPAIKEKYIARVKAHAVADEIVKGRYWKKGKGCAVGCTIHSSKHKSYETELGIPEWLALVEDAIFEGLPKEKAMKWPLQFLDAIPVGVDLNPVKAPFLIFLLESTLDKFDNAKFPDVKKAIDTVIQLYRTGETDLAKFRAASAYAAAYAAKAAAYAAKAVAKEAAEETVYAAAEETVYAAAYAAYASAAAYAAKAVAKEAAEKAYEKFADKLLELLREAI